MDVGIWPSKSTYSLVVEGERYLHNPEKNGKKLNLVSIDAEFPIHQQIQNRIRWNIRHLRDFDSRARAASIASFPPYSCVIILMLHNVWSYIKLSRDRWR